jgi:hypothetical protein
MQEVGFVFVVENLAPMLPAYLLSAVRLRVAVRNGNRDLVNVRRETLEETLHEFGFVSGDNTKVNFNK